MSGPVVPKVAGVQAWGGVTVAVLDGVEVGELVGLLVAVDEGVTVGLFVGLLVGVSEGVTVGLFVGVLLGVTEGVPVGLLVGVEVGNGVFVGADGPDGFVGLLLEEQPWYRATPSTTINGSSRYLNFMGERLTWLLWDYKTP